MQLEDINLSGSSISKESLQSLLQAAPHLDAKEIEGQIVPQLEEIGALSRHFQDNTPIPLDADTTPFSEKIFHINRLFFPLHHTHLPDVRSYRQEVFQAAKTNPDVCEITHAFYLEATGDKLLTPCAPLRAPLGQELAASGSALYYSKQVITLNDEWQALASLSPYENMIRYHTYPEVDIDIQYSKRDNLYYVKCKTGESITVDIDFTLQVPSLELPLPMEIKSIVDDFRRFDEKGLSLPFGALTGDDYLQAITSQQIGACRHRAFAFKKRMDNAGISCRIVYNNCHAFAEVQHEGRWYRCDLGGYCAHLKINEQPHLAPNTKAFPLPYQMESSVSYEQALQTWERTTAFTGTAKEYYQQCINGIIKKRLIECRSLDDSDALHYALKAHCNSISKPIFYINSPDDVICSAAYMTSDGKLHSGPGGALHDFLTNPANAHGVMVINYNAFKPEDWVRFNTLLDKKRHADGTPIPDSMTLVGLLNSSALSVAPGSDFYSRFDHKETCPIDATTLASAVPPLPEPTTGPTTGPTDYAINLYHAIDWKERLLGTFVPHNGGFRYEDGELKKALDAGATTVTIQNGLWHDKEFVRFFREATQSGCISHEGRTFSLPTFMRNEGYDWGALASHFQYDDTPFQMPSHVLNPATLNEFICSYTVEQRRLVRQPGHIANAKEGIVYAYLTHSITDDAWALLLDECRAKTPQVQLRVRCAPGVTLPLVFSSGAVPLNVSPQSWPLIMPPSVVVVQSTDTDTTVAQWEKTHPNSLVLDVSECHDSDLLSHITGKLINEHKKPKLIFEKISGVVAQALANRQSVVLKGLCSDALAQELAPMLLSHAGSSLMIASPNTTAFSYLPTYQHQVTQDEKKCLLPNITPNIERYLATESLSALNARCRFEAQNPTLSSDSIWDGLHHLKDTYCDPGMLELSAERRHRMETEVMAARKCAVNAVFARGEPYAYLTGLSGVGKSTFVTQAFLERNDRLYQGEDALLLWATQAPGQGRNILFIDEANLSTSNWSVFEGLFNHPPGIRIGSHYYLLTDKHKVIFAGNPIAYGGERKLAPFFESHGNTVVFQPLTSDVLYERVLMPMLQGTSLADRADDLCQHFLEVYRYLCLCSDTDVLISPRELEMMALLTVSYCHHSKDTADALPIAQYFAYHLARPLVPQNKQAQFDGQFKPSIALTANAKPNSYDFTITPSRESDYFLLSEFLQLRDMRTKLPNKAQRFGGLGGMLLEGEPGSGKSELVLNALLAHGYKEQRRMDKPPISSRIFYRMPVSMPLAEKEVLLRHAFHQGAVVVIDEMNSSPMMERLLNALLMGTTPEGNAPKTPGFMIVGTQNPITMAGRRAQSTALLRRLTTRTVTDYSNEEMRVILENKGLTAEKALALVLAYQKQRAVAHKKHLSPAPTFRNVLHVADNIIRGQAEALFSDFNAVESFITTQTSDVRKAKQLLKQLDFETHFNRIRDKTREMSKKAKTNPKYRNAAVAAHTLTHHLATAVIQLVQSPAPFDDSKVLAFKERCQHGIDSAMPTLQQHRGWKKRLTVLLIALTFPISLPVYALGVAFGFFSIKSDSAQKVSLLTTSLRKKI